MGEGPPAPARRLRILFVINNLYTTGNGLAASARRTIALLRDAGNDVRVLSSGSADECRRAGLPAPDYPLPAARVPLVHRIIRSQGYAFAHAERKAVRAGVQWADVVHLEEPFGLQARAAAAARAAGTPCLGTYHIHPENITATIGLAGLRPLNEAVLASWVRRVYRHCAVVQCPSENVRERLAPLGIGARLVTISNGVPAPAPAVAAARTAADVDSGAPPPPTGTGTAEPAEGAPPAGAGAPPSEDSPPDGTARPGAGGTRYRVLVVGRFSREKDQGTVLRAMRHSANAHRIDLVFAGRGPTGARLRRDAARLVRSGVLTRPPRFAFLDADGLAAQARAADLYVHSATIEVEGLSCLEVLRHGVVPVIARSPHSATAQFARDPRCLYRAGDARGLARAIDYWLEDDARRRASASRYRGVGAQYDIRRCVGALIDEYAAIA